MKTTSSVFESKNFANPPNEFRPLQIVHGLDRYLSEDTGAPKEDADPAGQWTTWIQNGSAEEHQDPGKLKGTRGIDTYLEQLAARGLGGIVTNVGYTDYLVSPRQWEILRYGIRKAQSLGLRIWLYDEKGYPSGTAGGLVTRAHPEYVSLGLACYITQVKGPCEVKIALHPSCRKLVGATALQDTEAATLADTMDLSDQIDDWGNLHWDAPAGMWTVLTFAERVMYEGTHAQRNVCEFKHYINVLNPNAIRAFLRVTHEAYRRQLPDELWKSVEAVFTDEPSFMTAYLPPLPERYHGKVPVIDAPIFQDRPPALPWNETLLDEFQSRKGYNLRPHLFALFFSNAEEACYVRQDYYEVITQRYTTAFYKQIQTWCQTHGIASSGHVLLEENILDHPIFQGSLFAVLRSMDLPGLDMLNSDPQGMLHGGSFMGASFMAVKQVTSAAHLTGRRRIHSESSDWEQRNQGGYATLPERYGQANLQYVLGVNQITSYFGWRELGSDAQRKYSDYVGRLGTLLTGGRHICDVAVLYPLRTLWAHTRPALHPMPSWEERSYRSSWEKRLAQAYPQIVQQLLCHQIDLDIIDEAAIIEGEKRDGAVHIGEEAYRVIVLPPLDALSLAAGHALAAFCQVGGILISAGDIPTLAESQANTPILRKILARLFESGGTARRNEISKLPEIIRTAIKPDFLLRAANPNVLYTHRYLEGRHVYFVINNADTQVTLQPKLGIPGAYTCYHPGTGSITQEEAPLHLELGEYEGIFIVSTPQ